MGERGMADQEGGQGAKASSQGCRARGESKRKGTNPSVEGSPRLSQYHLRIEGPLYGYRASVARAFDPKYAAFKRLVRLLANVEGVPEALEAGQEAELFVHVYWRKAARIDLDNCLKALSDGLWKQDRRIGAVHAVRHEHSGQEYAEILLTVGRGDEKAKDDQAGGSRGVMAPAQDGTSAAC
jgi:Holliday junction resolvase RusA-like endonuclease